MAFITSVSVTSVGLRQEYAIVDPNDTVNIPPRGGDGSDGPAAEGNIIYLECYDVNNPYHPAVFIVPLEWNATRWSYLAQDPVEILDPGSGYPDNPQSSYRLTLQSYERPWIDLLPQVSYEVQPECGAGLDLEVVNAGTLNTPVPNSTSSSGETVALTGSGSKLRTEITIYNNQVVVANPDFLYKGTAYLVGDIVTLDVDGLDWVVGQEPTARVKQVNFDCGPPIDPEGCESGVLSTNGMYTFIDRRELRDGIRNCNLDYNFAVLNAGIFAGLSGLGIEGPTGIAGIDGTDGAGSNGTDGTNGADGSDSRVLGPEGPTGIAGPDAPIGSLAVDGGGAGFIPVVEPIISGGGA